jgi:hypothetical protein
MRPLGACSQSSQCHVLSREVNVGNTVNQHRKTVSARQGTWCSGLPGVPTQWVPSLKLPGRAARSRGWTSTGEFQSIHGILSGTIRFMRR